jgi:SAM-dependent methyltransferase
VEARFYGDISLPEPVLDLGCGDGHFASLAFERPLDVGMDPWWGPIQEAASRNSYHHLVCAAGMRMPYPPKYFSSAVSNSVLEHIPDLDLVLHDLARVMRPGAPFIFCVPNHHFLDSLSLGQLFDKIKLPALGDAYRIFFNWISRHYHCDSPEKWHHRLEKAGFVVEEWWHYFSPKALKTLEWGHFFGVPSWVCKVLFGRWILVPSAGNLILARWIVQRHYDEPARSEEGVYSFFITRRLG